MGRVNEKTLRSRQYVVEKMPKDRHLALRREILAIREHEQASERNATAGGKAGASANIDGAVVRKEKERLVALNHELEDLEKQRQRLVERLKKLNSDSQTAQPDRMEISDLRPGDRHGNRTISAPAVLPHDTAATNSYPRAMERTTLPEGSTSAPHLSDQRSAHALSSLAAPVGDGAGSKGGVNTSDSDEASMY